MANRVSIGIPRGIGDIEIRLEGNWRLVDQFMEELASNIQSGYDIAVSKFSKKLMGIIKKSMITGTPPQGGGVYWEPLASSTIKKYGNHPIYYLTGLYCRSIGIYKYRGKTLIGLPRNFKKASNQKITLNQLAILLEYGSKGGGNIPPRPLWRPAVKSVGGIVELRKSALTEIRRKFLKYGFKANQVRLKR